MKLENLYRSKMISVRAYHSCIYSGVETISELLEYFYQHGSFLQLRNCGEKSNNELRILAQKYSNNLIVKGSSTKTSNLKQVIDNLTSEQAQLIDKYINSKLFELSIRSKNAIRSHLNGDISLESFWEKILSIEIFQFSSIKNLGEKSILEVKELINGLKNYIKDINANNISNIQKIANSLENIIFNLTDTQRELVNSYIILKLKGLSNRSNNALRKHLSGDITIDAFLVNIYSIQNFQLLSIKNLGSKSTEELSNFLNELKIYIKEASQDSNEQNMLSTINRHFLVNEYEIDIPSHISTSKSYFEVCDFLIKSKFVLDSNTQMIIEKGMKSYNNIEILSNDLISKMLNLSSERVRQIKVKSISETISSLKPLKKIKYDIFKQYGIEVNGNIFCVTDESIQSINKNSNTDFTKQFCAVLLKSYLDSQYNLIGNFEDVFTIKERAPGNRYIWKNLYLVKASLWEYFDFVNFINDINKELNYRIDKDYTNSLKQIASKFIKHDNYQLIDEITSACEYILINELKLKINSDREIIFERNTKHKVYEYTYSALELLNKPSSVKEIYYKVMELYPNYSTNIDSVRGSLKREFGFVPIGRTSVFALKIWEKERDGFKGGTIREIAKEYLLEQSYPINVKQITEYIHEYRPTTNEASVLTNLKLDESDTFCFFKNLHIGLTSKQYSLAYEKVSDIYYPPRKTWKESFRQLNEFLKTNSRFPNSTNCPEEEAVLYRWLNVQKGRLRDERLTEDRTLKLKLLSEKYPELFNSKNRNHYSLSDLLHFVSINKRFPIRSIENEKSLYYYYNRQKRLFESAKLNNEDCNLYKKIIEEIDNIQFPLF